MCVCLLGMLDRLACLLIYDFLVVCNLRRRFPVWRWCIYLPCKVAVNLPTTWVFPLRSKFLEILLLSCLLQKKMLTLLFRWSVLRPLGLTHLRMTSPKNQKKRNSGLHRDKTKSIVFLVHRQLTIKATSWHLTGDHDDSHTCKIVDSHTNFSQNFATSI